MNILSQEEHKGYAIKFTAEDAGKIIGRAYLYLIYNDLHAEPYGLMEDVFVDETYRGKGVGSQLVRALIAEAKARGCYKLIGTSRHARGDVHEWYKSLGFKEYGIEFRMGFDVES